MTIRKRGNSIRWEHVTGRTGTKRHYEGGTVKIEPGVTEAAARKQAQKALTASLAKHDAGAAIVKRGRLTVGQWLVQWLEDKERTTKDSTFATYSGHVNKHLIPGLGHIQLTKLDPRDITRFENDQRTSGGRGGKGLSETTVQHLHVTLRSALQAAVEDRLVATNAVDAIRKDARPTRDSHEMMTWDWDQLGTFLDKVKDHRFANIFVVMATTGARRGEVLGLRWSDVDLTDRTISIRRSRTSVSYRVVEGSPKSGRGRKISADAATIEALKREQQRQRKERIAFGPGYVDEGYCFTQKDGAPVHPAAVTGAFTKAVENSGLPRLRLHDLRHTAATLALADGIPIKVVSERLGHSSPMITLSTYTHVMPGMDRDAADRFGDRLFGSFR